MKRYLVPAAIVLQLTVVSATSSAQGDAAASLKSAQLLVPRSIDPRFLPVAKTDSAFNPNVSLRAAVRYAVAVAPQDRQSHRARNALIGGAIGSVVGVAVCTGFSTLMNDSARGGFSTCTVSGNLLFGVGGFAVGAVVGSLVR